MREEKNEIKSLIEDLNFEWGFFHSLFVSLMNAIFLLLYSHFVAVKEPLRF